MKIALLARQRSLNVLLLDLLLESILDAAAADSAFAMVVVVVDFGAQTDSSLFSNKACLRA